MSISLRIILIIASILSSIYVVRKIRKSQMKIEDALYWIIFAALILILSIFPSIAYFVTDLIGIESPANLIYLIMLFIVFVKLFSISVKSSQVEYKISVLTEEIAIQNTDEHNTKDTSTEDNSMQDVHDNGTII